nr:hypothetical protein [uncultured Fibrobacter sp.]
MRVNNRVASSPVSDFLIDGMTFEVGGKNKKKSKLNPSRMAMSSRMTLNMDFSTRFRCGRSD